MKKIEVSDEVYARLEEDRIYFEESIGGGDWSIDNTLTEYFKILNLVKEEAKKGEKV